MGLLLQGGGKNKSYRSDCAIPVVHSHEVMEQADSRCHCQAWHFGVLGLPCQQNRVFEAPLRCGSLSQPPASGAVSGALQSAVWTAHVFSPLSCHGGFHSSKCARSRWLALLIWERKASLLPPLPLLSPSPRLAFPSLPQAQPPTGPVEPAYLSANLSTSTPSPYHFHLITMRHLPLADLNIHHLRC
jgi:hypothetical protein